MRAIVVLAVLALSARHAGADPQRDPRIAKRLFTEGRALYDQQKYIEACVLFEKSYQLDPAVGTRLNLAECAERDGKPRAAWLLWVSAADEFDRDSDETRAKFARDRADALAAKLATVVVRIARPTTRGLTLQIGGRSIEPAATVIERLEEGSIEVSVTAPKREPFSTKVTVATGGRTVVEVPKLRRLGPEPEPEDEDPTRPRPGLWWGLSVGAGVLTLGCIGFDIYAIHKTRELENLLVTTQQENEQRNRDGAAWARNANIAIGVGIGGAVLTAVFVVKAVRAGRAARRATTSMVPVITPQVAGALFERRW